VDGLHTERGTITDVSYAGPITRFHVELEKGGRLQIVRQNTDSSPGADQSRKGQETTVGWLPEHTVAVSAENGSEPEPSSQSESPKKEEENL
jgi:putative spermidine/putrescine transport system ATP-binding protein